MNNPRKAAVTALEKCRRNKSWIDSVTDSIAEKEQLDTGNKALFTFIASGTLQNLFLIDSILNEFCSKGTKSIEPKVLDILRISVFQLYFCDKVPQFAVVNEAVELCKSGGLMRASGFVNGVLRNIIRKSCPYPKKTGDIIKDLSVKYSHTEDIVSCVAKLIGTEETEMYLKANNTVPSIYIQTNRQKVTPDVLQAVLIDYGIKAEKHSVYLNCIKLSSVSDISSVQAFRDGLFFVQDPAAYETIRTGIELFENKNAKATGIKVLDLCGAPGGKSMATASILGDKCTILTCDIHENKLKRIKENAVRLGFNNIDTLCNDATVMQDGMINSYDIVIADVPCSGFGVIRKKPEIRFKTVRDISELPAIQKNILHNAVKYLKQGGVLIYSTCTVNKEENEDIVSDILSGGEVKPISINDSNMLRFWPQNDDADGFFAAYFTKE